MLAIAIPFLFLLIISLVTRQSTDTKGNGTKWIARKSLEDLQHADDLPLLSHFFNHTEEKTLYIIGIKN